MLIYTRIVLVLAALGLIGTGINGVTQLFAGDVTMGLVSLLLAFGIGYFLVKDWIDLSQCIKTTRLVRGSVEK